MIDDPYKKVRQIVVVAPVSGQARMEMPERPWPYRIISFVCKVTCSSDVADRVIVMRVRQRASVDPVSHYVGDWTLQADEIFFCTLQRDIISKKVPTGGDSYAQFPIPADVIITPNMVVDVLVVDGNPSADLMESGFFVIDPM